MHPRARTATFDKVRRGEMSDGDIEVRVHDHGDVRLRGITRLIDLSTQRRPLPRVLGAMCKEASTVFAADVVSVYLREESASEPGEPEQLVMRGNIGLGQRSVRGRRRAPRPLANITAFICRLSLCIPPIVPAFQVGQMLGVMLPGFPGDGFLNHSRGQPFRRKVPDYAQQSALGVTKIGFDG